MGSRSFRKRQIATTALMCLFIVACVGAGFYFRSVRSVTSEPAAVILADEREVGDALARYRARGADDVAVLRTRAEKVDAEKAELVFSGICTAENMQAILSELRQRGIDAAFYFTADDMQRQSEAFSSVTESGFRVGLLGDGASVVPASGESALNHMLQAKAVMQSLSGVSPSSLLVAEEPSEELLAAACAAGINDVCLATASISLRAVSSAEAAATLLENVNRGDILSADLSTLDRDLSASAGWLVQALAETDLTLAAMSLVSQNEDGVAPLQRVYTTEPSVAFTFSGLGNTAELNGVLRSLKSVNGAALFFVTPEELEANASDVRSILDAGHDLGVAVNPNQFDSAGDILKALLQAQERLSSEYGYTRALMVRQTYGTAPKKLRQAASAGGFTLLSSMLSPVSTDDLRATNAAEVLERVLPESSGALQRGEIVHFEMNLYQQSDTLLGELVRLLAETRCVYSLRSVIDILENESFRYTYPVPEESILPAVKDRVYPGQLSLANSLAEIQKRYIGIDWVSSTAFLPGFTRAEVRQLDQKGLVSNGGNMVFLTFDDWGTDATITRLLDVLRKHDAKATFFIRTQNVVYNPNLLRSIAVEGHTIGSHTHTHYPLANDVGKGKRFESLSETQVAELRDDLILSYETLESIIGDVEVDGRAVLSPIFRPPTLAVSRNGLETVLDCGFTYSVSGTYTTQDYKAASPERLAAAMKRYTKSGSVLIMHMSDNSVHTAEALDLYLTELEQESTQYRFCGLAEILDS